MPQDVTPENPAWALKLLEILIISVPIWIGVVGLVRRKLAKGKEPVWVFLGIVLAMWGFLFASFGSVFLYLHKANMDDVILQITGWIVVLVYSGGWVLMAYVAEPLHNHGRLEYFTYKVAGIIALIGSLIGLVFIQIMA